MVSPAEIRPPTAAEYEVQRALEEAVRRQAERGASHIRIAVVAGVVTLADVVHSWAERQAAVGAAEGSAPSPRAPARPQLARHCGLWVGLM